MEQLNRTVIHVGQNHPSVDCFGKWDPESSNAFAVFDDEYMDGVYCDGGANWTEVAKKLADYAQRCGTTLVELSSC